MLRSLSLAFTSLSDRRVIAVLAKVMALSLAAFVVLGIGLWFAIDWGFAAMGWQNDGGASALASALVLLFSGWVLLRSIAVAMTWVFADDIIDAVEDRHYPFEAAQGRRPGYTVATRMAVRSVARVIGYNLLMLPVYLILLISGIGTPLAFLLLNGYLLGRDLEDMLVARHGKERAELGAIRRFMLGLGSAAAMLIPLLQIIIPVVATAMAVHMVHDKTGKM
jgi:CysZ protein